MAKDNRCLKCECKIHLTESEKLIKYGPVLKCCPKCGSLFFDTRVNEMALTGVPDDETKFIKKNSISTALWGLGLTVVFIIIMVLFYESSLQRMRFPVILALGPVFLVIGIYSIIKDMCTISKRRRFIEQEMLASRARCQNPNYMNAFNAYRNALVNAVQK